MAGTPAKNSGGDKHPKATSFMHGLKTWITSPGGIITLVGFALLLWYLHHNYKEKA